MTTPNGPVGGSRLHALELVAASPNDSAIYYEWLLDAPAGDRPGEGMRALGVESIRTPEGGERTGWSPIFAVDSIDEALARVESFDVAVRQRHHGTGRRADVVIAPGVRTGLIEAGPNPPVGSAATGRTSVDYFARDLPSATRYFEALLGRPSDRVVDDPYDMRFLLSHGLIITGVFSMQAAPGLLREAEWFAYFEVHDIASVIGRAVASGSRVRIAQDTSPFNEYAVLDDPFGQRFALSELHAHPGAVPMIGADGTRYDLAEVVDFARIHDAAVDA